MFPNLCNKCMNYLTSTVNEYRGDAVEGADGFFSSSSEKTKMSSHLHWEWFIWRRKQIATNIYHKRVCWKKIDRFSFTGSFWHINSLLSCTVPRISVVTSDQLVTRGSGSESRRSLKISSMLQDSFLLQFVPWISIYLVFLPFSCLLSNFLDVDECTSQSVIMYPKFSSKQSK